MTDYDGFRVDRDGAVARVTLDVPGKLNRVSMAARDQLSAVFADLDADEQIRFVVLAGAGGHLTSGGDIAGFLERSPWQVSQLARNVAAPERCSKPVIARLEGYVQAVPVFAVAARTEAHRGEIGRARQHVVLASRLRPLCTAALPISAQFLVQLAHACLESADPAGARAVLRQVREILMVRPGLGTVASQADALEHMLDRIRVGPIGASSLTAAELRLLPLLATHLSYPDIGERLHLSRNTVKSEAVSLFRKLGVSSRREAVDVAEQIGLLRR